MGEIIKEFRKKAIFFTIDAFLAATIIVLALVLANSLYIKEQASAEIGYFSQDLTNVLSSLKVSEVDNQYIQDLISGGTIENLNNSILEQIGEFWSIGKSDEAVNIAKDFIDTYIDERYGYGLYINDIEIYVRDKAEFTAIRISRKMISGIEPNTTRLGHNARATASKIKKNTTEVFSFSPEGSAHGAGNTVDITKNFALNTDKIINGTFYFAVRWGTSSMNSNKVNINGVCDFKLGEFTIIDSQEKNNTEMFFAIKDITSCLQNNWNEITITLHVQNTGHTRLIPGSRVEVEYESSIQQEVSTLVTERIYFDNIESHAIGLKESGAWAILPIIKSSSMNLKNVTLQITGKDILNKTGKDNVQIYLNNKTVDIFNPPCAEENECNFTRNYDLLSDINEGTNVLSVYMNSYPADFWGKEDTILYSDPENDPDGSSYVEIVYEISPGAIKYGMIDVGIAERFNTPRNNSVVHSQQLMIEELTESSIYLVQLDSENVNVHANNLDVFETPRPLATPSQIHIDIDKLINGTNIINVADSCTDCYILNHTLFYYKIFVPSFVGYGETFETEEEAIEDAKQRLEQVLGENVNAVQINNETVLVGGVPSLWGPAILEVRVWE